jgi:hypothetical protein
MSLPDGADYLLRPVARGMCRYESLKDGTLTLEDVFLMNTYLDNETYNRTAVRRYLSAENGERT